MSRTITLIQSEDACGWYVIEDATVTGALSTDEATAHVAARMLAGWPGFPREPLDEATGALCRDRIRRARAAAVEAVT